MKSIIFAFTPFYFFISCNNSSQLKGESTNNQVDSTSISLNNDSLGVASENISQELNYTDESGFKQGKHVETNSAGTVIKVKNFRNDTLNGYYFNWSGIKEEGNMSNGKRNGLFFQYYDRNQIMYILNYEMDSLIFVAPYSANQTVVVPHKPIKVYSDSLYLQVNHPEGNIWYDGLFIDGKAVSVHNVFFKSGILRGIINYELGNYVEFDSTGKKIIESGKIPVPYKK